MDFNDYEKLISRLVPKTEFVKPESEVYLWGAGFLGVGAASYLKKNGYRIDGFIDKNIEKQGKYLSGIPIVSPDSLYNKNCVVMLSVNEQYVQSIKQQLRDINVKLADNCMLFDEYCQVMEKQKIKETYTLLKEPLSQEIFLKTLWYRATGKIDYSDIYSPHRYFALPLFAEGDNEVFIDAGAYDGEETERFIRTHKGKFKRIYAFEPFLESYNAMIGRIEKVKNEMGLSDNKFRLVNAGLSDTKGWLAIHLDRDPAAVTLGSCSENGKNPNKVKIHALDEFLMEKPTFIKMDIEGMEVDALKGARNTIIQGKPKMAICVYHYIYHFYEVLLYIHNLRPDYQFYVRHHGKNKWDTVLYCM